MIRSKMFWNSTSICSIPMLEKICTGTAFWSTESSIMRSSRSPASKRARIFSRFGSLFWRNYLVAATDRRLLFVQHGGIFSGFAAKKVDSLGWHEIDRTQLGWGIFNKNLAVRSQARGFTKTVVLGRFWMKGNFPAAEGMVQTWTQTRGALGGGAQPSALLPR